MTDQRRRKADHDVVERLVTHRLMKIAMMLALPGVLALASWYLNDVGNTLKDTRDILSALSTNMAVVAEQVKQNERRIDRVENHLYARPP